MLHTISPGMLMLCITEQCRHEQNEEGRTDQVVMQAIQQQPEELLSIVLAPVTEIGAHWQLSDAAEEVRRVHSVVIPLGIHLHPTPHGLPNTDAGGTSLLTVTAYLISKALTQKSCRTRVEVM